MYVYGACLFLCLLKIVFLALECLLYVCVRVVMDVVFCLYCNRYSCRG